MARKEKEGPTPFDYVKTILNGDELLKMSSGYAPYIINRSVAHHRDNIFICQLLNEIRATPEQHYTFLFHKVSKHRRPFEKWVSAKKEVDFSADLELVAKYYQCSLDKARQYLALHNDKTLEAMRQAFGGEE